MNNPLQQQRQAPPLATATLQHPGQIRNVHALMQHLHNSGGKYSPIWVHHSKLGHVAPLIQSGHAIPHPGIPIPMPDPSQQQQAPQGYAQGGMVGADPQDLELAPGITPQSLPGAIPAGGMNDQNSPNEMNDWLGRNRMGTNPGAGSVPTPEEIASSTAAAQAIRGGGGMGAIHPPPSFGGGPTLAPQQIDNGAIGRPNIPQGLGGLNVGNSGIRNTSLPPQGLGGLSVPPQPIAEGSGGANPFDYNPISNSIGTLPTRRPDNRRMKKGGVVKKYAKGGVVDDEDEDDPPKKKAQKKR